MDPAFEEEEDAEGEAPATEAGSTADARLPLRVTAKLTRASALTSPAASLSVSLGNINLLRVTSKLTSAYALFGPVRSMEECDKQVNLLCCSGCHFKFCPQAATASPLPAGSQCFLHDVRRKINKWCTPWFLLHGLQQELSFWSAAVTSARIATDSHTLSSSSSQRYCCRAVLTLGQIEFLHPGFHTDRRLWPVGYVAQRLTATPASGGREVPHRCEVLAAPDGSGPLFRHASLKPLHAGRAVCILPAGWALHKGLHLCDIALVQCLSIARV